MMTSATPTTTAVACMTAVDPPVAEDPDHHRGDGQDHDPRRDGQRGGHAGHGLGLDDQLGGDEPDVQQQHGREHERRPVEPELAAALDRLRHAEPRSLGGVQRDQQRADQRPGGDRDQRPPEGQPDRDGDAAEDDVEDVDVAAEPERELVPRFPVPRARRGCGRCAGSRRTGAAAALRAADVVIAARPFLVEACWCCGRGAGGAGRDWLAGDQVGGLSRRWPARWRSGGRWG